MVYPDRNIEKLLQGIYSGEINPRKLPRDLYLAIAEFLKQAVYMGLGYTLGDAPVEDVPLLMDLRRNVYLFSAAKTYNQVLTLSSLVDRTAGFDAFQEAAMAVFEMYNRVWLETEAVTAMRQAQNALKWKRIEAEKEFTPLLKYSAIIDKNTTEICLSLDGIIAAVDNVIWNEFAPQNHYNCRCVLLQLFDGEPTDQEKIDQVTNEVRPQMQDIFLMNPGKLDLVFSPEHPYFQVPPRDKDFARKNFGLPLPKKDI